MTVKHISDVKPVIIEDSTGTTLKMLISPQEAPNFAMRCITIQPGGSIPNHTNSVEHEQFVLGGHGRVGIGDQVFETHKGSILFIPAEIPHWCKNIGEEPLEFLCLVPNKPDIKTILSS